jgi:hypothetical protein
VYRRRVWIDMSRPLTDVLVFALDGMRFALPAAGVVEQLAVDGERLRRLARLAESGVLGASGLPLLRLSSRLGIAAPDHPRTGALLLVGEAGRVRGTVLLDAEPVAAAAELRAMPATIPEAPARQAALIAGIAVLPAGERAILLHIPTGILRASAPEVPERGPRALVVAPAGNGRDRLRALLRRLGHEVSLAEDPRAARLSGQHFDTIVLDLDAFAAEAVEPRDGVRLIASSLSSLPRVPNGFDGAILAGDVASLIAALAQRKTWAA